jgi:hypothetical protein
MVVKVASLPDRDENWGHGVGGGGDGGDRNSGVGRNVAALLFEVSC